MINISPISQVTHPSLHPTSSTRLPVNKSTGSWASLGSPVPSEYHEEDDQYSVTSTVGEADRNNVLNQEHLLPFDGIAGTRNAEPRSAIIGSAPLSSSYFSTTNSDQL